MPTLSQILHELDLHDAVARPGSPLGAALSRRAWLNENGHGDHPGHESLEWLGDRVLGGIVATELWARFPHAAPSQFDLMRDAVSSQEPLAETARQLGLLQSIRMGIGERSQGQVDQSGPLSDHLEAVIAAVFLTTDWARTHAFVLRILGHLIPDELPSPTERIDSKTAAGAVSALNELVQKHFKINLPKSQWQTERVGGTDNAPIHQTTLTLPTGERVTGDEVCGSKAAAKQAAAVVALDALRKQLR